MQRFLILILIALCSCATRHHALPTQLALPQTLPKIDGLVVKYRPDYLEQTANKRATRWAHRKNINVVGLKITNTTRQELRGFQIRFKEGEEEIYPENNPWIAKKVRQRAMPVPVIGFLFATVESLFWQSLLDTDDSEYESYYDEPDTGDLSNTISGTVMEADSKQRKKANKALTKDLLYHQLGSLVIAPGETAFAIVGFRNLEDFSTLNVELVQLDWLVNNQ